MRALVWLEAKITSPFQLFGHAFTFSPVAWQDHGGEIVRQIIGMPTIWQGAHGHNPNRPLISGQ
jgi:hypothetical protein